MFKHFVVHPDTVMDAHLASCAAGKQGKFTEFKNLFWKAGFGEYKKTRDASTMAREALMKMATQLGLDTAKLKADMDGECKKRITDDMNELRKFQVNGTPSFFVNGKFTMFPGPDEFKKIIDAELKEVEKSGVPADQYYQKVVMEQGSKTFRSKADAAAGKSKTGTDG